MILALAVLALITQSQCHDFVGGANNRHLLQQSASASSQSTSISSGPDSQAQSAASSESMGGTASATAFASSETVTEATNIVIRVFNTVLEKVDPNNCDQVITEAKIEVEAQASAVAESYSSAFGEVSVDGDGSACADAQASGSAEAQAFVDAVTKAVAEQPGAKGDVSAEAAARVISAGVAKAFTDAFATTCTTGGFGQAAQDSFATAMVTPFVQVIVQAIAGSACSDEKIAAISDSFADGTSGIDDSVQAESTGSTIAEGDTTSDAGGSADASTDQVTDLDTILALEIDDVKEQCRGVFFTCCSFFFDSMDSCPCTRSSRQRCNAKKIASSQRSKVVWEDEDGSRCFCR